MGKGRACLCKWVREGSGCLYVREGLFVLGCEKRGFLVWMSMWMSDYFLLCIYFCLCVYLSLYNFNYIDLDNL